MIFLSKINKEINIEEPVIPGSQTFASNGTFVAPYTTTYNILINSSRHKAGAGGSGGAADVIDDVDYFSAKAGGGGGGGGGQSNEYQVLTSLTMKKNESYIITVNENMISIGDKVSIATGTAAKDGNDSSNYRGAAGGVGEGSHTVITPFEYTFNGVNSGTSGGNGNNGDDTMDIFEALLTTLYGGDGGNGGSYGGGKGGNGQNLIRGSFGSNSTQGTSGYAASVGSITISWGDS